MLWPYHDISIDAGDSTITVRVAADYFAIGEEDDLVRVPLSPLAAQRICDMFDATLPTSRLSDLLWKGADVRLDEGCRFRAYRTLDLGVQDYLSLLKKRFTKAWPAVISGSAADFCHLLKVQGYYTANEQSYTSVVVGIYNKYSITIPAEGAAIDVGTPLGVQRALVALGHDPGPVNGLSSPKLAAAVKAFQSQHALSVDGIVGPNTRAALLAALKEKEEASRPREIVPPAFEPSPPGHHSRDPGHGPAQRLTLIPDLQPAHTPNPKPKKRSKSVPAT